MSDDSKAFVAGILLGVFVSVFAAFAIYHNSITLLKTEAVKNGAAHWAVQDDGKTEFRWGKEEQGNE